MILTGGISITDKEIEYVTDAVRKGWDEHHSDYKVKFEKEFAKYVGSKYAYAVTGGTQALWLSLAALNIGPGDEVIIPELTYFACSDVVKPLGATPVFVDILRDTWCIDPVSLNKAITPDTRVIMPVYAYGNAPEMEEIMALADKYDLYVVEDACPAVGTFYKDKHAGTFGDFGCFSFHGAKIMTTGFGGMVVTDNKELYDRVVFLDDHGEDKSRPDRFWQKEVGYTFYMHNINAAMGLAQLERIEEFVSKKRQIHQWYKDRLIKWTLNTEQPASRTNMWFTSILVPNRARAMARLKSRGIDTRPFFYPISMFPMYENQDNPVAYDICLKGINLPSGVQRTEGDIDLICEVINES